MIKRFILISLSILFLTLPLTAWAANIPAKVLENGSNNNPLAVSGVKVEVLGGYGFKALLSSTESGGDGGCVLKNVPLGKDILIRLTKPGYIPQDDVRSYSDADVENGVVLWIGSEANVKGLYNQLGLAFDSKKGQVYLEISNENTGEGIEGVQLSASSGAVFDLGQGEYLIANAEGAQVKIAIAKPGYAFDVESAAIPLFSGAMTQYYITVQSGGAVFSSDQAVAATSAPISGFVKEGFAGAAISGVSVAFNFAVGGGFGKSVGGTARPTVTTNSAGFYIQQGFQFGAGLNSLIRVTANKAGWTFRMPRIVYVGTAAGVSNVNLMGTR